MASLSHSRDSADARRKTEPVRARASDGRRQAGFFGGLGQRRLRRRRRGDRRSSCVEVSSTWLTDSAGGATISAMGRKARGRAEGEQREGQPGCRGACHSDRSRCSPIRFPKKIVQVPGSGGDPPRAQHGVPADFHRRPCPCRAIRSLRGTGYSFRAKWERDTLVVETVGFNDGLWADFNGSPLTDRASMTERFRRPNFGTLEIAVTIDNHGAYTKPWTVSLNAARQGVSVSDSAGCMPCLENERDVPPHWSASSPNPSERYGAARRRLMQPQAVSFNEGFARAAATLAGSGGDLIPRREGRSCREQPEVRASRARRCDPLAGLRRERA